MTIANLPFTVSQQKTYKDAGYQFYLTYKEWTESFGDYIRKGFPTTKDALELHIKSFKRSDIVQIEIFEI